MFASFVGTAFRSLIETRECFILADKFGYTSKEELIAIDKQATNLYFKLQNLRNYLTESN